AAASLLEPTSGRAEVRERGGRFPHRGARRMRRGRGRGRDDRGPSVQPTGQSIQPGQERESARDTHRERTVSAQSSTQISIADLLKEGQEIIVQIAKEPLGQKGA